MRAIAIEKFGGLDELKLMDLPVQEPLPNEVRIRVAYTSANPVDWKISEGLLKGRLPHEFPIILGWDVSGWVEKVGSKVTNLKVNDEVFAYVRKPLVKWGSYAEYVCFDAQNVVKKPANLTMQQAAAMPLVTLTAWQAVVETAKLTPAESILIQGGAGGVGNMAIQIARNVVKAKIVATTARQENHAYLKSLGATLPIDYTKNDVMKTLQTVAPAGVDVVFDCVGGKTYEESYRLLKSGSGRIVSLLNMPDTTAEKTYGVKAYYVFVRPEGSHLQEIAKCIEQGKLVPPAIEEMPLEQAHDALEKLKEGHSRGKIVLKVAR